MTRWLIVSLILTALALGGALVLMLLWPGLIRESVPVHWDINMQPDGFVSREGFLPYLLIFPGVMALLVLLMWLLPKLSPKNFEVERFGDTWGYVFTLIVGLFAYLFALQVWASSLEDPLNNVWFGRLFIAGFFVMFALMGNVMGKVQRNFWMGIRTPWTLASDAVWVRTHRLAAWTWMPLGIVGAVLVLLGVPPLYAFVLLAVGALWPVLYSLILYKRLQREGRV
jgi:uncharacterized membrane protein